MIKREDILHKTTYVWKENEKYTSIIKNDGSRVILNKKDSDIWKIINDDDTVDDIIRHMKDREKDIDALKKVGCEVIHFGVESGSQEIIKKIGKNINLSWAKEIMCYANKQNIHVVASFIIGHFCDTERTIQETISLMEILRNSGIEVSVAGCVPFPGTPLYEHKDKLGISIHAHSWQEYDFSNMIISTSYLSQEQLRELLFSAVTKIS